MPALPGRTGLDTSIVLLAVTLFVTFAGCSGLSTPVPGARDGWTSSPPDPPLANTSAEDRSLTTEEEYVRENKVLDDADSWEWGGLATPRADAAATDDGWFVHVRVGFWYTRDTSEGKLHADGVSKAAYFVTPNATTRVSLPGNEIGGSGAGGGAESLRVSVVNTADTSRDVSLTVGRVGADTLYARDVSVAGESAAYTPRLSVSNGTYEVVATVDDETAYSQVSVTSGAKSPGTVTVFVAPDGSVAIARTPRHH